MSDQNKNLSVICVYNNHNIFNDMLLKGVNIQSIKAEIVGVDNSANRFSSAAEALNYGVSISSGDYLIFAHQDIEIQDEMFFESILNNFEKLEPAILGVAGKVHENNSVYTNIKHGKNFEYAGSNRVDKPIIVDTLDEVLVAIPKDLFNQYKFDEITCTNWHLYVVDLCLTLGTDNIESYVIPCEGYHKSKGSINKDFMKTIKILIKKHKKDYNRLSSTCIDVKTNSIDYFIKNTKVYLLEYKLIFKLNNLVKKRVNRKNVK